MPRWQQASHHMNPWAAQRERIVQGAQDAALELGLAVGQAGQAPLAGAPVARRGIEKHLLQAMGAQAVADFSWLILIGEQVLNRLEAILRSGRKAL